jgi:hypothetical protein
VKKDANNANTTIIKRVRGRLKSAKTKVTAKRIAVAIKTTIIK